MTKEQKEGRKLKQLELFPAEETKVENIKTKCKYCGEETDGRFCCRECWALFEDEPKKKSDED